MADDKSFLEAEVRQKIIEALKDRKADAESVELENKSALDHFRKELKKLKENK